MLEEKLDTEKPENTLHEESDTAPVHFSVFFLSEKFE